MLTRRAALKSLAAASLASLVPTICLRRTVPDENLLLGFCADYDHHRYDLADPFALGSLTYATDGRSACRAELANRMETDQKRIPANMAQIWDNHWIPSGIFRPFELPAVDSPKLKRYRCPPDPTPSQPLPEVSYWQGMCPLCDDRRVSFGPDYPTDLDTERDLPSYDPDDNTIRDTSCPLCHGQEYTGPWTLDVDGVRMSYSRLKPIAALPNVRIVRSMAQELPAVLFVADGFEGIACGLDLS